MKLIKVKIMLIVILSIALSVKYSSKLMSIKIIIKNRILQ